MRFPHSILSNIRNRRQRDLICEMYSCAVRFHWPPMLSRPICQKDHPRPRCVSEPATYLVNSVQYLRPPYEFLSVAILPLLITASHEAGLAGWAGSNALLVRTQILLLLSTGFSPLLA